ncbi:hypothetical protein SAY87_026285 [Trapa incisa]|uniref:Uncharacterized protein n=1 Tax=Trapa incisa TaxID=236973 RepID=A0AAN7JKY7_9MYRT|nr:hypothetical protein SAY87_026285 [Trapa incisa]
MAISSPSSFIFRLALCLFLLSLIVCPATEAGGSDEIVGWLTTAGSGRCDGTIGECLGGVEFEFDSESNRRILAASDKLSYQVLSADYTPSCGAGNSYYNNNCGGQANPYNRPCSKQAGCRG